MRNLLTCIGEILIDLLPIEEDAKTVGFRMRPGGSPFNVAMGVARLGQPVAFAGKVANDFFGRYLRAAVEQEGIDTRFLLDSETRSTLAFVAMEDGEPSYAFYGEGAADTLLTVDELPEALFEETGILHGGSISLLRGSTPAAVLASFERLKGKALLSLDPNIRPGLVQNEAAYRALLDRMIGLADIVKISAVDLAWLMPGENPADAAHKLVSRGPALVVVTRGGEGVSAIQSYPSGSPLMGVLYSEPGFPVQVVDTVGAGDAFNAGLLAALAERGIWSREALLALSEDDMHATLRFASATAALTCTRPGADLPRHAEVEQLLGGE